MNAAPGERGARRQTGGAADRTGDPLWDVVSEMRFGVLDHSIGLVAGKRESGAQINMEILFISPELLTYIFEPRPHLGLSINNLDYTSFLYSGLSWSWNIYRGLFFGFSLGFSVHDGWLRTHEPEPERSLFGSRVLFRESLELGYRIDRHSLSAMLDHQSNAGLFAARNQGNDDFGMRYGYAF